MADDDNPQYGQRGANAAYWEMVRRQKSQQKAQLQSQISQPQIPQVSQEEMTRRRLSELLAKTNELKIDVEVALADAPQKRTLLEILGYTNVREMRDIDVGRLLRTEYAEAQRLSKLEEGEETTF